MFEIERDKAQGVIDRPLKRDWIKQRSAGGGRTLDYIEGGRVKKLLIEAFENNWSWEILHWEIRDGAPRQFKSGAPAPQPPYVIVHGKLTVPGFGEREAFGSKVIQFSEGSDQQSQALKSASTDAFKVAASYFGIALDLYLDDAEFEESEVTPKTVAVKNLAHKIKVDSPTWLKEDIDKINEIKQIMGIDNDGLDPFIKDWSNGQLGSIKEITPDKLGEFNKYLEGKLQS